MYKTASWNEVRDRNADAHRRFEEMVKHWINIREVRLCFRSVLAEGTPLTPETVMGLFVVRVKHNFKWMSATCKPELMAMLVATGSGFSKPYYNGLMTPDVKHFRYIWSTHHAWWEGSTGNNE